MRPAPAERCTLLELGCGDAGNLIPMSFGLPKSRFVGVDLAAEPLAKGRTAVEALGLTNIALHQLDVAHLPDDLGRFDYIIAHGLYSWVPPPVQDAILAACGRLLAEQGVAYVSYNTFPGFHLRQMVREMLLYHIRTIVDPRERIDRARQFAQFLGHADASSNVERAFFREEIQQILLHGEGSLFHDDLAAVNIPRYFEDFVAHAARHGLQYLGEANFFQMHDLRYPPEVRETLARFAERDVVKREQYLDFLNCRRFRQTLLCRDGVVLDREPDARRIQEFYLASSARPTSESPDVASPTTVERFTGPSGSAMATSHPLAKAALLVLGQAWPQALSFADVLVAARRRAGTDERTAAGGDADELSTILFATFAAGLIELRARPLDFSHEPGERPLASPLARLQARDDSIVTTLRHTSVEIEDELGRTLLVLLDGTRDRAALLRELALQPAALPSVQGRNAAELLDRKLTDLARLGLLLTSGSP